MDLNNVMVVGRSNIGFNKNDMVVLKWNDKECRTVLPNLWHAAKDVTAIKNQVGPIQGCSGASGERHVHIWRCPPTTSANEVEQMANPQRLTRIESEQLSIPRI